MTELVDIVDATGRCNLGCRNHVFSFLSPAPRQEGQGLMGNVGSHREALRPQPPVGPGSPSGHDADSSPFIQTSFMFYNFVANN